MSPHRISQVLFLLLTFTAGKIQKKDPAQTGLENGDLVRIRRQTPIPKPEKKISTGANAQGLKSSRTKRQAPDRPLALSPEDEYFENDKVDPFVANKKWARFVKYVSIIANETTDILKKYASTLGHEWSEANPFYVANKETYFKNFSMHFEEAFRPLVDYFEPIHDRLEHNAVYTFLNPLIGLQTIPGCLAFAKANSSKLRDQTRVKWIEINALATTANHVFDRLYNVFTLEGLDGINEAIQIPYPSWLARTIVEEDRETYEDMAVETVIDHIHQQMDILGDKFHLMRGLERLVRKQITEWNPRETDYNIYCYGNNLYGIIYDEFDILTDAALFLSIADIKFTLLKMTLEIYKQAKLRVILGSAVANETEAGGTKILDFGPIFEEHIKNLTVRLDKKIRFVEVKESSLTDIIPGPTLFKCDRAPINNVTGPILSSPLCPQGVYILNNSLYFNETQVALPTDIMTKISLQDGTPVDCVRMENVGLDPEGNKLLEVEVRKGKCIGPDGNEKTGCTVTLVPVIVDEAGVPVHREPLLKWPQPFTEWGKITPPQALSPLSNGTEPALDSQEGTPEPNDTNRGYLDQRTPVLDPSTVAQFSNAFGGYLESELVLSPDGTCAGTCLDYKRSTDTCTNKTTHCDLYRNSHCEPGKACMKKSNCPNKARRCIRTAPVVTTCQAKGDSGRLYQWLNFKGRQIGMGGEGCATDNIRNKTENLATKTPKTPIDPSKVPCDGEMMVAKERWEMAAGVIMNTPQYCELCLCICDDPLTAEGHHNWDMTASVADVFSGFVVSSVRFEKIGKTMRLSVEQGKLLEDGEIDLKTLKWEDRTIEQADSHAIVPLGVTGFKKMNLDGVYGQLNEAVSGVRFKLEEGRLELEVQFIKIDDKGIVKPPTPEWRSANYPTPVSPRRRVDLQEVCSPYAQKGPSQPFNLPANEEFIEFDATSLEKDAGQNVVPFFDLQPVAHFGHRGGKRPLTSVGILYKSKIKSGGILTPAVSLWEKTFIP